MQNTVLDYRIQSLPIHCGLCLCRFVKIKNRYLAELPVDSPLGTLLAFFSKGKKTSQTAIDRPKLNSNLTASTQDVLDSIKASAGGGTGASNETPRLSREKGSLSERTRLEAEQKREGESYTCFGNTESSLIVLSV